MKNASPLAYASGWYVNSRGEQYNRKSTVNFRC
jgi:hypothetical protein